MEKIAKRIKPVIEHPNYEMLISALPPRSYGYARKVAIVLNHNKIRPTRAKEYSVNVVHQTIYKGYFDIHIESALILLIELFYGKKLAEILPNYVRRYPRKTMKMPQTLVGA